MAPSSTGRDEADGLRDRRARSGPSPTIDARQPGTVASTSSRIALLGSLSLPDEQRVRRLRRRLADLTPGSRRPLGTTRTSCAPSRRASWPPSAVRRGDHQPRPARAPAARATARPARQLDVGPPDLHARTAGPASRPRRQRGRDPVRVDEIGVARSPRAPRGGTSRGTPARAGRATAARAGCRTIPSPYAIPKWRNDAGETTSTSHARDRAPSATASATKLPGRIVALAARVRRRQHARPSC